MTTHHIVHFIERTVIHICMITYTNLLMYLMTSHKINKTDPYIFLTFKLMIQHYVMNENVVTEETEVHQQVLFENLNTHKNTHTHRVGV